jgi:hypothetical protein
MNPRLALRICSEPDHLRRTGFIALVVGTWLTLFNQPQLLFGLEYSPQLALKVFLNYMTPFVVANFGLISRKNED